MKIVTVIPVARGVFRDYLTYFSAQDVAAGDLVTVPVRQKMTNALVVKTEPLEVTKTEIKKAAFGLKKIGQIKARQWLSPEVMGAAQLIADYSAAPLGPVLKSILPQILFEEPIDHQKINQSKEKKEKLVLQDSDQERLSLYKGLVREAFAKNESVFICEPTMTDLLASKTTLEKGIGHYTVCLYNQLEPKTLKENWQRVVDEKHPLLILGTPLFLIVDRPDLKTIIIDRESASSYRGMSRPFIDYRRFAEILAERRGARFILGDIVLRPETSWRVGEQEFSPIRSLKQRLVGSGETNLVTVRGGEIWSDEARELIGLTAGTGQHLFLLANRRGLSPLIICDDCGEAVLCHNCDSPIVLHQKTTLRCHHCGEIRQAEEKCRHCQSWRLRALGTGIDLVAQELTTLVGGRPVFQLDSDKVKSYRAAELVVKKFLAVPGAILLGTEMAINYLPEKITHSLVVTIDSMLALPDFRLNEKVFFLLARLREKTAKKMLIQSRQSENETLRKIARGQVAEFYREEIAERERFDYPPFRTFIKISRCGPPADVRSAFKNLTAAVTAHEPVVYQSLHQPGRGQLALNLLLKVDPKTWPEVNLVNWLKQLSPEYGVTVDPETLL